MLGNTQPRILNEGRITELEHRYWRAEKLYSSIPLVLLGGQLWSRRVNFPVCAKGTFLHWPDRFKENTHANTFRWALKITRGLSLKVEEALAFLHSFRHQLWNKCYCLFRPENIRKANWQRAAGGVEAVEQRMRFSDFQRFVFNSCWSRFIGYLSLCCTTLMDF